MNIEPIQGGCLRVWLTEEELERWGLLTPEPDRRQVRRLVRQVMDTVGRCPSRVTAELIPVMGGGVLLISPRLSPEEGQPMVYRVEADALLALWEQWPSEGVRPVCALYELGEEYRLVVWPDGPLSWRQMHLLLEYGTLLASGDGAVAHVAEYGTLVALGDWLTERGHRPPEPSDSVR